MKKIKQEALITDAGGEGRDPPDEAASGLRTE